MGESLIGFGDWQFTGPPEHVSTVPAEGAPGGHTLALRGFTQQAKPDASWDPQFTAAVPVALAAGQWLRLRLWARSANSSLIILLFERNGPPYNGSLVLPLKLSPEWTEYAVPAVCVDSFGPCESAFRVRLGFTAGHVEICGMSVEDCGSEPGAALNIHPYGGEPNPASWRAAAAARIGEHRMAELRLAVADRAGAPVHGAAIRIEQLRHHFQFGTALNGDPLLAQTENGRHYRAHARRLFNCAVFENALKWRHVCQWGLAQANEMLTWCAANGLPVRGHNLLWPGYQNIPPAVAAMPVPERRAALETHIRWIVEQMRGRVVAWDTVNEASYFTELLDDAGRDLLWKAFEWARETDPAAELLYNDANLTNLCGGMNRTQRKQALRVIAELLDRGAPVTMLGDEGHLSTPFTPVVTALECWDELARFGLPIAVTEFDIAQADVREEEFQAGYLADYLTAAFSVPAMRSFTLWGFWDGAHWRGTRASGLYRKDWSPRPMVLAFERLVHNEWWTRAEGASAENGIWSKRVFLGRHRVTITAPGHAPHTFEIDVTSPGGPLRHSVQLPD